ncbi:CDP-diacylglycerol--serine O-phosphatidyltransferase [Desulfovibrio sulfodismutans]|uniref:CDP-diacylglycerol--serine O-phosphatidyltransferase n=1 Tax=Desulfolutivibrio sulfodismutans TaxID=63561 RepID=A0A7K3NQJ9_9BACT|nr:CDP-diacylglycerol--serine O-phosphatidyltransferase [Desulfolutivibrio sulfodismutans]NDY58486.1 CDP-diacylglycerol--serine O-phosphatidyltransferase [Desulfolutivibrio sulfodismutans]QLA10781.1 CDP-diacylglycerol--serine O-phosphatidyltransferase [Desulfolutivibrio sulfodismutans DSM 3696]
MDETAQRPARKGVYILPNLLTVGSLFCGFMGILWALEGRFDLTALAILVSCLFDGLDGKVARMTRTSSDFGVQLDSLCDLVAFGVTPAIMLYQWELHAFGRLGIMACFLMVACGALRLARFNVQAASGSKKFFVGLPIPAAGCIIATLYMFTQYVPDAFMASVMPKACLVIAYIVSFLMVSRVRYACFKEFGLLKAHPFRAMVTAILLFVMVASEPKLFGFLFFFGYMISGPVYTFLILPRRSRALRESLQELS